MQGMMGCGLVIAMLGMTLAACGTRTEVPVGGGVLAVVRTPVPIVTATASVESGSPTSVVRQAPTATTLPPAASTATAVPVAVTTVAPAPVGDGPVAGAAVPSTQSASVAPPKRPVAAVSTSVVKPPVARQQTPGTKATAQPGVSPSGTARDGAAVSYVVRHGDTFYSIAKRYHTTVDTLARLNNIADPSRLPVGTTLQIP